VLVAPGDPVALADGIRRLLSDGALARRLAERAYHDAAAYSWAARAERIDALLRTVVEQLTRVPPVR
jgi:glycosyltransferase involved in cell wall biosynthesis